MGNENEFFKKLGRGNRMRNRMRNEWGRNRKVETESEAEAE
jgi:hypothetical protein